MEVYILKFLFFFQMASQLWFFSSWHPLSDAEFNKYIANIGSFPPVQFMPTSSDDFFCSKIGLENMSTETLYCSHKFSVPQLKEMFASH